MATISLKPIDRLEILSVMDNSVDVLMSSTPVAQRAPRSLDSLSRPQLRAEHGVSMLVTTYAGGNKDSFLFDTGVTVDGVLHNMDVLEVKANELHAIVLSHGHTDHTRGLIGLIRRSSRRARDRTYSTEPARFGSRGCADCGGKSADGSSRRTCPGHWTDSAHDAL